MFRYPPFYDPVPYEIYKKIADGHFEFSNQIAMNARELILGLLTQDISKRLGCMKDGANDIK